MHAASRVMALAEYTPTLHGMRYALAPITRWALLMKLPLNALMLASFILSGCTAMVRTNPVSASEAKQVPSDRLLAYQENKPEYLTLSVTRDEGFMGGGCYIGLEIEGILAGRFDPEENATFYLPSVKPEMRVVPDPLGKGLCSIAGWTPVDERYVLKTDQSNIFRISLGAYRRPRLLPSPR